MLSKTLQNSGNFSSQQIVSKLKFLFKVFFLFFIFSLIFLTTKKSNHYLFNYENLIVSSINHSTNSLNMWLSQQRQLIYNLAHSDTIINYLTNPFSVNNSRAVRDRLTNLKSFSPMFTNVLIIINTQTLLNNLELSENTEEEFFNLEGNLSLLLDTNNRDSIHATFPIGSNLDTLLYAPHILNGERTFFIGDLEISPNKTTFPIIQVIHSPIGEHLGAIVFNVDLQNFIASSNPISVAKTGSSFITDSHGLFLTPSVRPHLSNPYTNSNPPIPFDWLYEHIYYLDLNTSGNLQHIWVDGRQYIFYSKPLSCFYTIENPLYIIFMQEFSEAFLPVLRDFLLSDFLLIMIFTMASALISFFLYEKYHCKLETERFQGNKNYSELLQLSLIDDLTGLFNRTFFRQYRNQIESHEGLIGIIIIDIDGLKIINDTFGHEQGDEFILLCSKVIKGSLPKVKVARIGGDEFMCFLLNQNYTKIRSIVARIKENVHIVNKNGHALPLPISFSIGWSVLSGPNVTNELFKEADALLYKHKSEQSSKLRASILKNFSYMLSKIDPLTTSHYLEILHIANNIAKKIHPIESVDFHHLQLLVRYHNIGLITYDKNAQNLSNHIQTGYRIALYLPKLTPIANLILSHEELYCGKGPLGIKGKEIPIECRILTVALLFTTHYYENSHQNSSLALHSLQDNYAKSCDPDLVEILSQIINTVYPTQSAQ